MRATALFILLALAGFSYQQDTNINVNVDVCPAEVLAVNQACLRSTNFGYFSVEDLSDLNFCAQAFTMTRCIDASCIDPDTSDTLRTFVPQLFRPNICPICSDIPFILENSRKVCTAFGIGHVIPYDRQPYFCTFPNTNGTVLLNTTFITVTGLTNGSNSFTGVRFDYHGCIAYSRTWNANEEWSSERVPTAGWFPHTIRITQNSTQVSIALAALNTDIIITKNGPALAVSIGYGVRASTSDAGVCVAALQCIAESNFILPPPTTAPCTSIPLIFATGCQFDLLAKNSSNWGQNAYDAARIDATLKAIVGNGTVLQELDFRRRGLPIVLTIVPTGAFVAMYVGLYFWRRRVMIRHAETMSFSGSKGCCNSHWTRGFGNRTVITYNPQHARENMTRAPIRAIWCWMVFCLNAHALGLVYSFTGLVLLSMFCGVWIFLNVAKNLEMVHWGNSRFSVASGIVYKVIMSMVLVQQAAIGIIGVVAYEYYLYELQFWWGIAVLIFMFIGAFWMMIAGFDLTFATKLLIKGSHAVNITAPKPHNPVTVALQPMPRANNNNVNRILFGQAVQNNNQNHVIVVEQPQQQQQHVIPNAVPIQPGVQMSDHVIPPPQAHIMQGQQAMNMQVSDNVIPPPQAHVIQPQPVMYGNGFGSPPENNPYIQPAPVDMIPGYGSVNITANSDQSDPCHRVAKRTIKMAALDLDPSREEQISQKVVEMLQSMGVAYAIRGEDGESASLRNDLAKNLAEEVRMYKNDSIDELSYGFKEAILLWKDEHKIT